MDNVSFNAQALSFKRNPLQGLKKAVTKMDDKMYNYAANRGMSRSNYQVAKNATFASMILAAMTPFILNNPVITNEDLDKVSNEIGILNKNLEELNNKDDVTFKDFMDALDKSQKEIIEDVKEGADEGERLKQEVLERDN